ncbi:hypothetical protein [Pseudomonas sp. ICMP 460]|uniref:hypothetical protein n=1 Tax=Pseudomonas sp. ICMP 460 TaxID=1718917 RepID=UPI000C06FA79|nr:hypothetical protein [Pseudomonas sp. ICMP 460]PHN32172.1 hypothetical protein AO240_09205 [Pseudomonas sp. ICMP 460]
MNVIKPAVVLVLNFFAMGAFACDFPKERAFEPIPIKGGAIIFDFAPIENESVDKNQTSELGIDINFLSCSDGSRKTIGQLPYLAETGKVRDAFLYKTDGGSTNDLFVIHSVEIRSDTGVRYSGEYYTISIYKNDGDRYVYDEGLSKYFGNGADILAENYEDLIYTFPYKSKVSILKKLNSESYRKWRSGDPVNLVINKKTLLYRSPVLTEVTSMYLVPGDLVSQEAVESGWLSIVYKTLKGRYIHSWIQCANANGC